MSAKKGKKNLGGSFGAWMKSSCEFCSWLLSLARRTGRGAGSEGPAARRGWGGWLETVLGQPGGESWLWAEGLAALVSSSRQRGLPVPPLGVVQAWKSSPWLLRRGWEQNRTIHPLDSQAPVPCCCSLPLLTPPRAARADKIPAARAFPASRGGVYNARNS